jgi:hypothetical protein
MGASVRARAALLEGCVHGVAELGAREGVGLIAGSAEQTDGALSLAVSRLLAQDLNTQIGAAARKPERAGSFEERHGLAHVVFQQDG